MGQGRVPETIFDQQVVIAPKSCEMRPRLLLSTNTCPFDWCQIRWPWM